MGRQEGRGAGGVQAGRGTGPRDGPGLLGHGRGGRQPRPAAGGGGLLQARARADGPDDQSREVPDAERLLPVHAQHRQGSRGVDGPAAAVSDRQRGAEQPRLRGVPPARHAEGAVTRPARRERVSELRVQEDQRGAIWRLRGRLRVCREGRRGGPEAEPRVVQGLRGHGPVAAGDGPAGRGGEVVRIAGRPSGRGGVVRRRRAGGISRSTRGGWPTLPPSSSPPSRASPARRGRRGSW